MFECTICNRYARRTLAEIMRHIAEVHPYFESPVRCGIEGCPSTRKSYHSLRQHMYQKHKHLLKHDAVLDTHAMEVSTLDESLEEAIEEEGPSLSTDDSATSSGRQHPSLAAAQFILKTRDGKKLPQTTLDGILQDTRGFLEQTVSNLYESVKNKLKALDKLSSDEVSDVLGPFSASNIANPFQDLETQFKQEDFFQKHLNYVPPAERVLGRTFKLIPRTGLMNEVRDYCYDVPLFASLQALLRCEDVRDQIFNSHQLENGKLGDYCDGTQYREHGLFKEDPCALQITLYYDELEVCNPLGSKVSIHKLGIFYYMLGNIDPKYRSSLHTIQLVTVAKSSIIQKYTIDEILEPFISDITLLESDAGVPFFIDGQLRCLRGTLTIISADNPAANAIGGFKSLTSAFRKCRSCMATEVDMQTKFHEKDFVLRTRDMHASHCASLNTPLHDHIATTYGMTSNSMLNTSRFFHVVDGIVPDLMHDVLEGTLQLNMKWLLKYLILDEKNFSLDTLNGRMQSFDYGMADSSNKPTPISYDTLSSTTRNNVKQSSSQAWCLGRFLPLLIGDLVCEEDDHWNNFLLFLKIMEFLFAPVLTNDQLDYLEILIEDYLADFKSLYPHRPLVPKMHYLIHMPAWMKRCGPLVRYWCMRYEARHKYFKKMAQILGNFTNIAKTVATRHQRHMCYKMTCTTRFLGGETTYGGTGKNVHVAELKYATELLQLPAMHPDSIVYRVPNADIFGTKYAKGSVVMCTPCDDDPLFGKIIDVLVTDSGECLFILNPVVVSRFNGHFNSYEVELIHDEFLVYQQKNFADYHLLSLSKSFDTNMCSKSFVCLKYYV